MIGSSFNLSPISSFYSYLRAEFALSCSELTNPHCYLALTDNCRDFSLLSKPIKTLAYSLKGSYLLQWLFIYVYSLCYSAVTVIFLSSQYESFTLQERKERKVVKTLEIKNPK